MDKGRAAKGSLKHMGPNVSAFCFERSDNGGSGCRPVVTKPGDDPIGLLSVGLAFIAPSRRSGHDEPTMPVHHQVLLKPRR
jgi:hypothetical protein